jgi:hypothetical protein
MIPAHLFLFGVMTRAMVNRAEALASLPPPVTKSNQREAPGDAS